MSKRKSPKENDVDFVAYCCGMPMLKEKKDSHIHFWCASGRHGSGFSLAIDPKGQSFCSCDSGKSPLITNDFGDFRLLGGCQYCETRYSAFTDGASITFEVQGSNHNEVKEVTSDVIAGIWNDSGYFPHKGISIDFNSKDTITEGTFTELMKAIKPDITIGVKVDKSKKISGNRDINEVNTGKEKKGDTFIKSLIIGIITSAIATLLLEYFGVIDLIKNLP
jgi:hypothetical protein